MCSKFPLFLGGNWDWQGLKWIRSAKEIWLFSWMRVWTTFDFVLEFIGLMQCIFLPGKRPQITIHMCFVFWQMSSIPLYRMVYELYMYFPRQFLIIERPLRWEYKNGIEKFKTSLSSSEAFMIPIQSRSLHVMGLYSKPANWTCRIHR